MQSTADRETLAKEGTRIMASCGRSSPHHLEEQQKEEVKSMWICGLIPVNEEEDLGFVWFKLNPEDPNLITGSRVLPLDVPPFPETIYRPPSFAVSGSRIYLLGGDWGVSDSFDDVHIIDLDGTDSSNIISSDSSNIISSDSSNIISSDSSNIISSDSSSSESSSCWTRLPPMPCSRLSPAGFVVDGKVYVFGGARGENAENLTFGEVFDLTTETWEPLPDIPADPEYKNTCRATKFSVLPVTVAGGYGKPYFPVHLAWSENLMGYCLEDRSWFCVDPNFSPLSRYLVLVDDVIYSLGYDHPNPKREFPIMAYHLPTKRSVDVVTSVAPDVRSRLIYFGNSEFWLFRGCLKQCRFVKLEVRKKWRGPELVSISIIPASSGKFFLDAGYFNDVVAA